MTPEDVIRAFFDAYSSGRPERFDEIVSADYADYGHTPPGHGPHGARHDYEQAVQRADGVIRYDIDALVARGDAVAAAWTGHLPNGTDYRGPSLYQVINGQLTEARHALIGALPV